MRPKVEKPATYDKPVIANEYFKACSAELAPANLSKE
jgi:hypothetical protein